MTENVEGVQVWWRGPNDCSSIYHADIHIGAWWCVHEGKIVFSHFKESLIAWCSGADTRRFGAGADCYNCEADGPTLRTGFWVVVNDSAGFDEAFETSKEVSLV